MRDQESLPPAETQALFGHWRLSLMGNRASRNGIPASIGGYFYHATNPGQPIPLAILRRDLLDATTRASLTPDERLVLNLYYGFHGLPLPFGSKSRPDIAAGRDESTPRKICRAALAKVAKHLAPRPLAEVQQRPIVDPILEPWFQAKNLSKQAKINAIARAFVKSVSMCDGPHGRPTLIALARWYSTCGYTNPLIQLQAWPRGRPNKHALARAAALMEITLFDETDGHARSHIPIPSHTPQPAVSSYAPIELASHPDLVELATEDLTPAALVNAAVALQALACQAHDVRGQLALLLRLARPHMEALNRTQTERLCVAVSYTATTLGNPFVGLEMLGIFLSKVGVTDRIFTVLVNTIEAAASSGHHKLAHKVDHQFASLQSQWLIPSSQIPLVEHTEAIQQRLIANSFRLQWLSLETGASGNQAKAAATLEQSMTTAIRATVIANQVLTDDNVFPQRDVEGKSGTHGGDLTASWLLAAAARTMESARHLADTAIAHNQWTRERLDQIHAAAKLTQDVLPACESVGGAPGFDYWRELAATEANRLAEI